MMLRITVLSGSLLLVVSAGGAGRGPERADYRVRDGGMVRSFAAVQERGEVALYETGGRSVRRVATPGVLVQLRHPGDAAAVAAMAGAASWRRVPAVPGAVILDFPDRPGAALPAAEALRAMAGVTFAGPLLARQQAKRWIPDDPYFGYQSGNAGYQWHLRNTGQNGGAAGLDIRVSAVWDTWRGRGIRIGIADDGLQVSHPDLQANADTVHDYDWNDGDADPSPSALDAHGTCCAGAAAARGGNGLGVCGAAPEARLVGLRLIARASTDETEAQAMLHESGWIQIKSNSWGPEDDGATVEGPGPLTAAALREAAESGRGGLGTVFCWAGGNGRTSGDDANYDGYANSIFVIATGAVTDGGTQASYSEPGANLLICAPSGGGFQGISTTDLAGAAGYNSGAGGNFPGGDYTKGFTGTSAACPLVAGGIALLLEAAPHLTWRDVKEILIRSATQNAAGDAGWFTNAAGFHFNDKYGAGLFNAGAAVALAAGWVSPGPMAVWSLVAPGPQPIPDHTEGEATQAFSMTSSGVTRVEQVAVAVEAGHGRRGELEFFLTSPSGTVCRLARPRPDGHDGLNWTFTTPQFWGEPARGRWVLRVRDTVDGTAGVLHAAALTLYGTGFPDADRDGFFSDEEAWFGTSDGDAAAAPWPRITGHPAVVAFPSVPGNRYALDWSSNLQDWETVFLTGSAGTTLWVDPGPQGTRRYYRVRKP